MAAAEGEEQEPNSWEELLRNMLPVGAPLPDEEQLDYSISVDYIGPPPFFKRPTNPVIPKTRFAAFPKQPPSLTPRNPSWLLKSRSSSDTTNSDNKGLSASSIAFDDAVIDDSNDDRGEIDRDHCDHRDYDDGKMKMRLEVVSVGDSSIRNKGRECKRCGKRRHGVLLIMERVACIVCGAEYCKKCVLKAMGSMPEGRKCVGCIGKPIGEANRRRLGKVSRVLRKICSPLEVKQIMQVERECKTNQVRPEQVIVNGRELTDEELETLLACAVPPRDLKPRRYWYDKDSGLWGKEGEKPDRIISSKLHIGGKLQAYASRGNTRVYMNGREITEVELRVLKLAGVQCPRDTHFWLYEDGSYEEEGQNNIKGYIWEKASIRFLCSLFSLPVPNDSVHAKQEPSLSAKFRPYLEQVKIEKLLLLGLDGSETGTIFKQAKFIYTNKFTLEELQNNKLMIQSNVFRYLSVLLEGRELFEEEDLMNEECAGLSADRSLPGEIESDGNRQCIYSINQKFCNFSDWFLDLVAAGDMDTFFPAAAREYAPFVYEIWNDPAIQKTYKRREELQFLPDVANHFLERVIEISSNEYEPSQKDILYAEGVTPSNGIACVEFTFGDQSAISQIYNRRPLSKYQLIQLSSKGSIGSLKWLEMFEGVRALVFSISLSDYDRLWTHTTGVQQNKMLANRDFFERIAHHSCFGGTPCLLLLNKCELFDDKIKQVPLSVCEWFRDFNPFKSHSKSCSLSHQAYHYIATKFKRWYTSITGRKLHVCQVKAYEPTSVDEAFRYLREILEWEEMMDRDVYALNDEESVSGAETCSSPCSQQD